MCVGSFPHLNPRGCPPPVAISPSIWVAGGLSDVARGSGTSANRPLGQYHGSSFTGTELRPLQSLQFSSCSIHNTAQKFGDTHTGRGDQLQCFTSDFIAGVKDRWVAILPVHVDIWQVWYRCELTLNKPHRNRWKFCNVLHHAGPKQF